MVYENKWDLGDRSEGIDLSFFLCICLGGYVFK